MTPLSCMPTRWRSSTGDLLSSTYWGLCAFTPSDPTDEALAVVRSATQGEMPSWFADTYNDSDGDPDLERVWDDVKAIPDFDSVAGDGGVPVAERVWWLLRRPPGDCRQHSQTV